jgi:archaellum component FlaC
MFEPPVMLYGIMTPEDSSENIENDLKKEVEIHKRKPTIDERLDRLEKLVERLVWEVTKY